MPDVLPDFFGLLAGGQFTLFGQEELDDDALDEVLSRELSE